VDVLYEYLIVLVKLEYPKMKNLTKEWGMTNIGQYCRNTILESHYPEAGEMK
jgi:hypothetical protein